ncbi:O-antigen ligase family protein [Candidatus Uhrbacteria bacterium]|nr:O-antigen ligase family protein [Candidatus Uhrbacteria bacterium]
MTAIFLILTAAFAVLTWADLHKGLFLLVAVLPSYLLRTELFGVPTTLLELLAVTFLVVWVIRHFPVPQLPKGGLGGVAERLSGVTVTAAFLLLAATIAVFVAPDRLAALGVWKAYFIEPILLFFAVRHELLRAPTPPSPPSGRGGILAEQLFVALGVSALVLSLIAIFQWLTGSGLPIPWDIERRVTSVFDYPNALGLFLGPIVVIAFLKIPRAIRTFWLAVALLSSIAIILAQSEAAIVSIVATLLIAGLWNKKTRIFSSSLLALLVLLVLFVPALRTKLTLQDYSGSVRLSQWTETVDMLRDHWFLGAGLSGYPTLFEPYHQATHLEIFQYPHNIILNIWVELGLLGLVSFVLLAWQILLSLRGGSSTSTDEAILRRAKGLLRSLALPRNDTQLVALLALLQMTIHGLVDVPYFKNDLAILTWILLAIIFAYAQPAPASKTSRS